MLAVLTSKGQLTLPKGIRERLGLTAGSRLDFQVNEQGWLVARPVTNTALGLAGLLRRPGQAAVSVEDMNDAVLATAAQLNPRPGKGLRVSLSTGKAARKSATTPALKPAAILATKPAVRPGTKRAGKPVGAA